MSREERADHARRGINSATNANIRFAKTGKLGMVRTVTLAGRGRRPLDLGRAVGLPTLTTVRH